MTIQKKYLSFAFPVTDITIARYLAAKELDYIGIPLEEYSKTSAFINQLKEWVEGPLLIGLYPDEEQYITFKEILDGFYFLDENHLEAKHSFFDNSLSHKLVSDSQYFLGRDNEILKSPEDSFKFCELDQNPTDFKDYRGVAFHPGHEFQTGLFDFDALDCFFDKLDFMNEK